MAYRIGSRVLLVVLVLSALAWGQESKRYKGAKLDQAATEEARKESVTDPGLVVTVYVTADPFEKVYEYYKSVAHEYRMLGQRTRKLPNGQELHDAFFLLDDAKSLVDSKIWVKIQRPYIGSGLARGIPPAEEIRDVTAIVLSERK
jgi:hypothetical protein